MNAFPKRDALEVVNCTAGLVRVRLLCTGYQIWDVWVGPAGAITVPTFAPPRLKLEARLTDHRVRVTHVAQTPWLGASVNVTARLERRTGADLFALPAQENPVANTLRLCNSCAAAMEYAVRYADSPYVLKGCLAPGATRVVRHGSLELVVILNGISVQQTLPAPHGRWLVTMLPQAGCFAVVDGAQQLDELHHQGLATPVALHRIAT
jgi:hypothetical protein